MVRFHCSVVLIFIFVGIIVPKNPQQQNLPDRYSSNIPRSTMMTINHIGAVYTNDGVMENNRETWLSGLEYPRGTAKAVYSSGILWGGLVNDDAMTFDQPRVNGSSYNSGLTPGKIFGLRTGVVENPDDPNARIWRIRKDYAIADLKDDAAQIFNTAIENVTSEQIAAVRLQYRTDWQEWPAEKGAPFYDADHDGIYSPQFLVKGGVEVPVLFPNADEPGVVNADQVVWYVANDIRAGDSPWKSSPIGLEIQFTFWGFNSRPELLHTVFKRAKFIYKGTSTTPDTGKITDMYFTHWSDPDLGDAGDDFAGCDTMLGLGYVYNSQSYDREYAKFKISAPAIGFGLLQGPTVPSPNEKAYVNFQRRTGVKNLPMTSFIYFAAGGNYSDPPFTLNGSWQWYSMMKGLPPTPQPPPFLDPYIDPATNLPTHYWLSGNPITKTGWIDGNTERSGDRRILLSTGPFTMALGDTQEVIFSVVGGSGKDNLSSISQMKRNQSLSQGMFNALFSFSPPKYSYSVTNSNRLHLKAVSTVGEYTSISSVLKKVDNSIKLSMSMFDDGTHGDNAANDGIWGSDTVTVVSLSSLSVSALLTTADQRELMIDRLVESITTIGDVAIINPMIVYDSFNQDGIVNPGEYVRYTFRVKNNTPYLLKNISAVPIITDRQGEHIFVPECSNGGEQIISYDKNDPKSYLSFVAPMSDSAITIPIEISDAYENRWNRSVTFRITKGFILYDTVANAATNIIGGNDAQVKVALFDPKVQGKNYELWFGYTEYNGTGWIPVERLQNTYSPLRVVLKKPYDYYPNSDNHPVQGEGLFWLSSDKNKISYDITIFQSSSPVAAIYFTGYDSAKRVVPNGNKAVGEWTRTDPSVPLTDNIINRFKQGMMQVYLHTEFNDYELRGTVNEGLIPQQVLPAPSFDLDPMTIAKENRLDGLSLFVAPAPLGYKQVMQIAPVPGPIVGQPNPEKTYRVIPSETNFYSQTQNESTIELRFTNQENWAMFVSDTGVNIPSRVYFKKVPFAAYSDTTRVWPLVYNQVFIDSIWNVNGNAPYNGKPVFDKIAVAPLKSGSGFNIGYYNNPVPPTSNTTKSSIASKFSHAVYDLNIVNEKNDSLPPVKGTVIQFTPFHPVKWGDAKLISIQPAGIAGNDRSIPVDYSMSQNYPNPFNPSTRIEFSLPRQSMVTLKVYDVIGREVVTLVSEVKEAGRYRLDWYGKNQFHRSAASGVYFYQIVAGGFVQSKKMILLK